MGLTGIEYAHSKTKRRLDIVLSCAAYPLEVGIGAALRKYLGIEYVTEQHQRMGANRIPFVQQKFATTNPQTGRSATFADTIGLNEIRNLVNVRRGTMSIVGWRATLPEDTEEFLSALPMPLLAQYERVVLPTRPGLISTFGNGVHTHSLPPDGQIALRAEMNIEDVLTGSVRRDLNHIASLVGQGAAKLVS